MKIKKLEWRHKVRFLDWFRWFCKHENNLFWGNKSYNIVFCIFAEKHTHNCHNKTRLMPTSLLGKVGRRGPLFCTTYPSILDIVEQAKKSLYLIIVQELKGLQVGPRWILINNLANHREFWKLNSRLLASFSVIMQSTSCEK